MRVAMDHAKTLPAPRRVALRQITESTSIARPSDGKPTNGGRPSNRRPGAFTRTLARILVGLLAGLAAPATVARDWPTERGDNHRSGVSPDRLGHPLEEIWVHQSLHAPRPAWPPPAKQDYWHDAHGLSPTMIYDRAFHVVLSGSALLYGSSADDTLTCLEAKSGRVVWTYTTEGPVRIAPSIEGDKVYFGSDDGQVYCLALADGRLLWRRRLGPEDRRLPGNGRMISLWPVRSGVVLQDGIAYAAAGLFPQQGSFLVALDATAGGEIWRRRIDVSVQGLMALSPRRLFLPTGRTPPAVFNRRDGRPLGSLGGSGGSFAVVLDDMVVHGGGERPGVDLTEPATRERIVSVPALRLVACGDMVYFLREGMLVALDRTRYLELSRRIRSIEAIDAKQRTAEQKEALARLRRERSACRKWTAPCNAPYELIAAADALIAGGRDQVIAYDNETGDVVWRAPVRGRAYGLAVSDSRLFASTDEGAIYCFGPARRAGSSSRAAASVEPPLPSHRPAHASRTRHIDDSVLGWWLLEPERAEGGRLRDLTGRVPARIPPGAVFASNESTDFIVLDGQTGLAIGDNLKTLPLPRREFSVEAWVRVDKPLEWGGIIGALQDNGSYEKGWLLGFSNSHFMFALKSESADRLTYLKAAANQEPKLWHHVAGTYDGRTMRLYVDGEPAATSTDQQGAIDYPERAFYEIGAYHDDDEMFGLTGAVHEVRVSRRVISPEEVQARYAEKAAWFRPPLLLDERPEVKNLDDGRARLSWWVDAAAEDLPGEVWVAYGNEPEALDNEVRATASGRRFEATLGPLTPRTIIFYRVRSRGAGRTQAGQGAEVLSPVLHFDSGPQPFRRPRPYDATGKGARWERAARTILERSGVRQGYGLVLGAGRGELAYELARLSDLRIIGVEEDAQKIAEARRSLSALGLWGTRIVIHRHRPDDLPYPDLFANLIVCADPFTSGTPPATPPAEIDRLLRPCGGTAVLWARASEPLRAWSGDALPGLETVAGESGVWATLRRGPLPGSGEWTQTYAEPGNTACSNDSLTSGTLDLQWFGRPGPRRMIDRHHRNVPPLYKDGRCFIPGDGVVFAVDAYNGTILWQAVLPGSRRLGVFLDSSNLVVDDRFLYIVAESSCHAFDVRTGMEVTRYRLPRRLEANAPRHWSYLARHEGLLLGSACKPSASYRETSHDADSALWYRGMKLVTSDGLFAIDRESGKTLWADADGVILNSTITLGNGAIYFVESRGKAAQKAPLGRMPLSTFFAEDRASLVALDARTGSLLYRQPLDPADLQETAYLVHKDGILLLSGSRAFRGTVYYHLFAMDARSGTLLWEESHDSGLTDDGGHGEYNRHPTVIGHTVYAWPYAFDLETGTRDPAWRFDRRGHGCGGVSASAVSLFWRGGNPWMFDFTPGGGPRRLTAVTRPGCWINIIPAGGLVLLPEASSGCTCLFSIQCSMAMRPGVEPPRIEATPPIFVGQTEVSLRAPVREPGGALHYTLDGREPDRDAPLYSGPIVLEETTRLQARTILPDGRKSRIQEWSFEKVTPLAAESPVGVEPGLGYRVFEGARIGSLSGMAPWTVAAEGFTDPEGSESTRAAAAIDLAGIPHRNDDYGVIWRGLLRVPKDGVYTFSTRSDDGSSLSIADRIVVDNDGLHGALSRSGRCALQAGLHSIEIRYFEAAGNEVMDVRWAGPGITDQPLPAGAVWHEPTAAKGGHGP